MTNKIFLVAPSSDPSDSFADPLKRHGLQRFGSTTMYNPQKEAISAEERRESFETFLQEFSQLVQSWGYDCIRPEGDIYGHPYQDKWSGSPELRSAQIEEALRAENVAAIFAVNGGGGSKELILHLQKRHLEDPFPLSDVPYIGISDATPVGLWLESIGAATHVQGPSIMALLNDRRKFNSPDNLIQNQQAFRDFLDDPISDVRYELTAVNHAAKTLDKPLCGQMRGGCCYNVVHACNTPHEPEWPGNILYLEGYNQISYDQEKQDWVINTDGPGFVTDGMCELHRASNVLDQVSAVVIGDIYNGRRPSKFAVQSIEKLEKFAANYNVPMYRGIPQGHDPSAVCLPIPMGTDCVITPGEKTVITAQKRRTTPIQLDGPPQKGRKSFVDSLCRSFTFIPTIKDVNIQDLEPFSKKAESGTITPGRIGGYRSSDDSSSLIQDSLCNKGFFKTPKNIQNLIIKNAHHGAIVDVLLRGQLDGLSSLILQFDDVSAKEKNKLWLDAFNEKYFGEDIAVYTYLSDEKLPDRFVCQLRDKNKSWGAGRSSCISSCIER